MPERNFGSNIRNKKSATDRNRPAVKSISRAASILLCLNNGISTVTDIADNCKLSKSTVHRILKALEESHIASQDPINHRYFPGTLITRLASKPQTTHEYLIICAFEEMEHLSDIAEETVTLGIMTGIQYVHLHEILSKHDLRVTEEGRKIRPMFMGATTKVLLSQLNDEELRIAMPNINLTPVTENTLTDKDLLMAQLKKIRKQGYAVSYGEAIPGALCISTPIRDYVSPAALSIVGPESRLKPKETDFARELMASASRISSNIAGIFE